MSNFFSNLMKTIFETPQEQKQHLQLIDYIKDKFPHLSDNEVILIYSVAGLIARIAYNDLEITKAEQLMMEKELTKWTKLDTQTISEIITIATNEMKLFAGNNNHKFCSPLIDILSEQERYSLLETLFRIAQSDGNISPSEEQEIRIISQALGLPHRYFTAARAQIKV